MQIKQSNVMIPIPCAGIGMLTFALLMSARMGIFQEMLYKQYGKHSKEALFYNVSAGFVDTVAYPNII